MEAFQQATREELHVVTDTLVNTLKANDPYQSIGPKYDQEDRPDGIAIKNTSDIWPFREYDTKPHFPPWAPRSALSFAGARTISLRGTQGNHLFANAWQAAQQPVWQALQKAMYRYVLDSMGTVGSPL